MFVEPLAPVVSVRFTANYDETIEQKIARGQRAGGIIGSDAIATSTNFPRTDRGEKELPGVLIRISTNLSAEELSKHGRSMKRRLPTAGEVLDLVLTHPRPSLSQQMPLVASGQALRMADGVRGYLYFYDDFSSDGRVIDRVLLPQDELWEEFFWHLFIEVG